MFTMRRINLLSGALWCLIFTISCTSQGINPPEVQIINPKLNTVHDLASDLDIEIDVSDDQMVMEYKFWLESDTGFEYFLEKKKVNKDHYKILYSFDLSDNLKEDFTIHLRVEDNHGNQTYRSVKVTTL